MLVAVAVLVTCGTLMMAHYRLGPFAGTSSGREQLTVNVATILSTFFAMLALLPLAARFVTSGRSGRGTPAQLAQARQQLLVESTRHVAEEVGLRGLVADELSRPRLDGSPTTAGELAELFDVPGGTRLMITGPAGVGTSSLALLIAAKLIAVREERGAVPVVFTVSSWDPGRTGFEDWLVHRVREDHALGESTTYGGWAAEQLVVDGKVLPILDGVDELAPADREQVSRYLRRRAHTDNPVIVTCRSDVDVAELVDAAALRTVQLDELTTDVALRYLAAREPMWTAVLDRHVRGKSLGVLVEALRTPLMVFLAGQLCRDGGVAPLELTRPKRFRDRKDAESHLLGAFVPAAYRSNRARITDRSRAEGALLGAGPRNWPPERAHRWLRFIARHTTDDQHRDIEWWRMWSSVPPRDSAFPLAVMVLPSVVSIIVNLILTGTPLPTDRALFMGWTGVVIFKLMPLTLSLRGPIEVQPALDLGFGCGGLAALSIGYLLHRTIGTVAAVCVALVVLVVSAGLSHLAEIRQRDGRLVIDPVRLLRRLRTTALVGAGCHAVAAGFGMTLWQGFGPDTPVYATGAALIALRMSAWSSFLGIRLETAINRELPWRLMTFLDDAAALGVLCRTGPAYRFRHDRLRDELAGDAEPESGTDRKDGDDARTGRRWATRATG
jgi:hypothetical protein